MPYLVRIPDPVVSNKFWVGADSVIHLPPKPKVTQAVMDWYERDKNSNWNVNGYLNNAPEELYEWLLYSDDVLKNQHALATLIAYGPEAVEVEKDKRYMVILKRTNQILAKQGDSLIFTLPNPFDEENGKYLLTKQELTDAGFEGVFDNPMFEVEEVEE
ncbi:DUF1642 domain-containing protein [Streptococcus sp. 121]|nr:DUF1642 domain-containing protein [Streptococcus sp. 121]